jgi:hypothetical protein
MGTIQGFVPLPSNLGRRGILPSAILRSSSTSVWFSSLQAWARDDIAKVLCRTLCAVDFAGEKAPAEWAKWNKADAEFFTV